MVSDAYKNVIALYEKHGADFDRSRTRRLMEEPWLDRFLAFLPDNASILDIGCGSGEPIARYLIENGCDVTGIDASSSLIKLCRERFPQNSWIIGDMREMRLEQRFDGLIAWHSLFHLTPDDQRVAIEQFARCSAEQAVLMFTDGPDRQEAIGNFNGHLLYHASLAFSDYEAILSQNAFRIVHHTVDDESCGGATVYLAIRSIR